MCYFLTHYTFCWKFCREEEIRTLGALRHTRFPSVLLKPLGHLSVLGLQSYEFFEDVYTILCSFKYSTILFINFDASFNTSIAIDSVISAYIS